MRIMLIIYDLSLSTSWRHVHIKESFLLFLKTLKQSSRGIFSQNSKENICAKVSFLIKLQVWDLQLYLKIGSGTGVFLWILRKFLRTPIFIEHLWWLLFKTMLFEFGRTRIFVEETCVCFIKRPSFRRDFILYFTSRLNALLELLPSTLSLFIGLVHEVVTQVF